MGSHRSTRTWCTGATRPPPPPPFPGRCWRLGKPRDFGGEERPAWFLPPQGNGRAGALVWQFQETAFLRCVVVNPFSDKLHDSVTPLTPPLFKVQITRWVCGWMRSPLSYWRRSALLATYQSGGIGDDRLTFKVEFYAAKVWCMVPAGKSNMAKNYSAHTGIIIFKAKNPNF